ncbi:hypothetical protein [Commensalibacter sp. Nvir]|uniref:hypothetical protein n=1 Tax=Commensalibacter sp. Nvir TaxID=3069817 RepID=UPI0030C8286A
MKKYLVLGLLMNLFYPQSFAQSPSCQAVALQTVALMNNAFFMISAGTIVKDLVIAKITFYQEEPVSYCKQDGTCYPKTIGFVKADNKEENNVPALKLLNCHQGDLLYKNQEYALYHLVPNAQ